HTRQRVQGRRDIGRREPRHAAAVGHLRGLDVAGVVGVREVNIKNLEVRADRVQVVLDAVSDGWDVRVPRHVYAYASSNCNSISRRCGSDSGRTTRYAVM